MDQTIMQVVTPPDLVLPGDAKQCFLLGINEDTANEFLEVFDNVFQGVDSVIYYDNNGSNLSWTYHIIKECDIIFINFETMSQIEFLQLFYSIQESDKDLIYYGDQNTDIGQLLLSMGISIISTLNELENVMTLMYKDNEKE